jgi:hypothetical protein
MDVFESDFQYYPNSTLSEISDISDTIRIRKNKVPIENIYNLFILLNTNYQ